MKTNVILFLLLIVAGLSKAQEVTFWQKVNYRLTKPAEVDTMFVYQPKSGFSLGLFTTGQMAVSTIQASVGGGYSANVVLWHKNPTGLRDQGLRNVTFNLTAMPVITFVNHLKTTSYMYDEESDHIGETISRVWCYPVPNYVGSAAVSLTWNRFFFTTQFTYNRFFFRSRDALDDTPFDLAQYDLYDVGFRGTFHDWTLKGLIVYRF